MKTKKILILAVLIVLVFLVIQGLAHYKGSMFPTLDDDVFTFIIKVGFILIITGLCLKMGSEAAESLYYVKNGKVQEVIILVCFLCFLLIMGYLLMSIGTISLSDRIWISILFITATLLGFGITKMVKIKENKKNSKKGKEKLYG